MAPPSHLPLRLALLAMACLGIAYAGLRLWSRPPTPVVRDEFVATAESFADYPHWKSYPLEGGGQYPRTVYVNHVPAAGVGVDGGFPLGTILVKELHRPPDGGGEEIDAMVKRSADYGDLDAPGWEWFGLQRGDGGALIVWRGPRPPAGGGYAGGGASCAGCHRAAASNDGVQSPPLHLH